MARVTIKELQAQIAEMARQLAELQKQNTAAPATVVTAKPVQAAPAGITDDELLAISAAIGAYMGVRAHIRQIRLVSTAAWAQQGRVSIQASHSLQG